MANKEKRSSLCGFESAIFDLIAGAGAATEQWAEWLRVPLQRAAAVGNLDLVTKLQRAGANGSALHAALEGGQTALALELVKRGAPVTGKDASGKTTLNSSSSSSRSAADFLQDEEKAVVSLLLEKGALSNALDNEGRSPLHVAAANGRLGLVNVFLAAGADTSLRYGVDDEAALDVAASKGHVEIVTELIRSGANVNAVDGQAGNTALHVAALANRPGVLDVLVEAGGADVNATHCTLSQVSLHFASAEGCLEAVLALLKNGARVDENDADGQLPLHWSALYGHLRTTKALLAAGADVNEMDICGRTALHNAVVVHDLLDIVIPGIVVIPGVVRVLVEAGATIDAQDDDLRTPLHLLLCNEYTPFWLEVMTVLLEGGANPNARDVYGNTPLHLAAGNVHSSDAKYGVDILLRWGADETVVNAKLQTPLTRCVKSLCDKTKSWDRIHDLLTQAPMDRKWRRRGWVLLYRAYPCRMLPIPGTGGAPSDRARKYSAKSVSPVAAGGAHLLVRGGAVGTVAGQGQVLQATGVVW